MRCVLVPGAEPSVQEGPVPSFSVIIPAYQSASFIAESVQSALEQTLRPHEVIVCDDGSTDDLAGALGSFEDRITLLRRPHGGAGAARNHALEIASGDFIAMLDADDSYHPERLRALSELAAARPDLDILGTDAYFEYDGDAPRRFYELVQFELEDQRLGILERCFVAWPAIRRSRVLEVGGFDESPEIAPAEDWDLFARLILSGSRAGIVAEPLLHYRRHTASMTADRSRALRSRVVMLEKTQLHPSLTPKELEFCDRCLARARNRFLLTNAVGISKARKRGARRTLLQLSRTAGASRATRLAIAAAAVAPFGRSRFLARMERRVAKSEPRRPDSPHSPSM